MREAQVLSQGRRQNTISLYLPGAVNLSPSLSSVQNPLTFRYFHFMIIKEICAYYEEFEKNEKKKVQQPNNTIT